MADYSKPQTTELVHSTMAHGQRTSEEWHLGSRHADGFIHYMRGYKTQEAGARAVAEARAFNSKTYQRHKAKLEALLEEITQKEIARVVPICDQPTCVDHATTG